MPVPCSIILKKICEHLGNALYFRITFPGIHQSFSEMISISIYDLSLALEASRCKVGYPMIFIFYSSAHHISQVLILFERIRVYSRLNARPPMKTLEA